MQATDQTQPSWATPPTWHPRVVLERNQFGRVSAVEIPEGCYVELRPAENASHVTGTAGIVSVRDPHNPAALATSQGYGDPGRAAHDLLARPRGGIGGQRKPVGRMDRVGLLAHPDGSVTVTDAPGWLHVRLREPGRDSDVILPS